MGLDGVEIVMAVEDAFDIAIDDDDAAKALTPGQLIELVMGKVGRTDRAACLTQRAFHRLRVALIRHASARRERVKPTSLMSHLLPAKERRRLLDEILGGVGVSDKPELVRPRALVNVIMAGSIALGAATSGWLWASSKSSNLTIQLMAESPVVSGLLVAGAAGWLGAFLTRPLRNDFPPKLATAGGFSRWIVAHAPSLVAAPPGQWSHEQVATKVREIVIEQLGCEDAYREDARFVEDLGMY
jgi:acyl carrier protein